MAGTAPTPQPADTAIPTADVPAVVAPKTPLLGTWADPDFRAHQEHKHPVEGCGFCPSEEDR